MLSERKAIRLMDTYRNLFYTPLYVAVAGGFLYDQGLDVVFSTVPDNIAATELLRSGGVDIVQTGISRSLMDLDEGRDDAPLHIAEINQRRIFTFIPTTCRGLGLERTGRVYINSYWFYACPLESSQDCVDKS